MGNKTDEYYKKYRYLIWRDDVGFLELENFSMEDLEQFAKSIALQIEKVKEKAEYITIPSS